MGLTKENRHFKYNFVISLSVSQELFHENGSKYKINEVYTAEVIHTAVKKQLTRLS